VDIKKVLSQCPARVHVRFLAQYRQRALACITCKFANADFDTALQKPVQHQTALGSSKRKREKENAANTEESDTSNE
jgi:hypothetical protein